MNEKVTYDKLEDPFPEYKWPVSLGKVIDFSTDEVWRTISMPGNLDKYHPFCLQNQIKLLLTKATSAGITHSLLLVL